MKYAPLKRVFAGFVAVSNHGLLFETKSKILLHWVRYCSTAIY